jgi:hypothetical protein
MTENKNKTRRRKRKAPYSSMSITTGDIGLNIDHFNRCAGTADFGSSSDIGGTALSEAKRYVRRYYARPMNLFASNKAEILKLLVDIGDQNCTIYTLNNLGDDKDVSKLSSHDIIYTYDDGILKDKNGIRVLDYDLSIKKEENRKKIADPNPDSKEFKAEYEDRMTVATELEEELDDELLATCPYDVIGADYNDAGDEFIVSLNHNVNDIEKAAEELAAWIQETYKVSVLDWNTNGSNIFIFELSPDNAFDMDFDDVNVFGESLTEAKERTCCYCGGPLDGDAQRTDIGMACEGCSHHFSAIGG